MNSRDPDGFAPLGDYAVLSDMRSTALVARDGSVDWWAAPVMNDPPVCAAVLDPERGGSVKLVPSGDYEVTRRYRPGTLVLETVYTTPSGTVRVTDSLNLGSVGLLPWAELARVVTAESGRVPMRWEVAPGHGLQASQPWAFSMQGLPMTVSSGDQYLVVVANNVGEPKIGGRAVRGEFVAQPGTTAVLALTATKGEPSWPAAPDRVLRRQRETTERWEKWSAQVSYDGPFKEAVTRSALTIKALTLQPTGGIAAAATTSLPEAIGGSRNYDYRFAWVRDGAFALDAMGRLGLDEELHAGASWLLSALAHEAPDIRVFYSVQGQPLPAEMSDAPAAGYKFSRPVHLGNKAAKQTQLGAYGDMADAIWRYVCNGGRLDPASADMIAKMVDRLCQVWCRPDAGLWELGDDRHYTSSKIGSWTALDRAVRMAELGQLAGRGVERWRAERAAVQEWVREHCWSSSKQSFTFYAGTEDLDAAVLLAARTRFCEPDDPMLRTTIDAIRSELTADGPLLYRYTGTIGKEGAFLACSFWLVEAMAYVGRTDEAGKLLGALLDRANDVGLFSEEMAPLTGELLGNIPQTLTHLAVIGAATSLEAARRT